MSEPNAAHTLYLALQQAQERHQLFPAVPGGQPQPVVVGVSGGADSVCLLHLLWRVTTRWHLALHVAHLDHNVRPASAQDAAFVQGLAEAWGLPFHSRRLSASEIAQAGNNQEAALRLLRYRFLAEVAAAVSAGENTAPHVAVAHTADDQTETILMHVLRGSGLAGLVGMRPVSFLSRADDERQPIRLLRPLLDVSRAHILQYLNAHALTWREDPTNQDLSLTRNRLRQTILPQLRELYPGLSEALTRLSAILAAENERAEKLNRDAFYTLLQDRDHPQTQPRLRAVLNRREWRAMDLATQRGVLLNASNCLGLASDEVNFARIEAIRVALDSSQSYAATPLAGDIQWSADADRFSLHHFSVLAFPPETPFLDAQWRTGVGEQHISGNQSLAVGEWQLTCRRIRPGDLPAGWQKNEDPWQIFCDAGQVGELRLTTPKPGQRFAPLGMGGHGKPLGDFFTDRKIAPPLRVGWPLLVGESSGEIVWVCGLRMAQHARLRAETTDIWHVKWSKE